MLNKKKSENRLPFVFRLVGVAMTRNFEPWRATGSSMVRHFSPNIDSSANIWVIPFSQWFGRNGFNEKHIENNIKNLLKADGIFSVPRLCFCWWNSSGRVELGSEIRCKGKTRRLTFIFIPQHKTVRASKLIWNEGARNSPTEVSLFCQFPMSPNCDEFLRV